MYAACSFVTGQVTGFGGIAGFGHVWTWVAFPLGSHYWTITGLVASLSLAVVHHRPQSR
jgi:hypothetical protein